MRIKSLMLKCATSTNFPCSHWLLLLIVHEKRQPYKDSEHRNCFTKRLITVINNLISKWTHRHTKKNTERWIRQNVRSSCDGGCKQRRPNKYSIDFNPNQDSMHFPCNRLKSLARAHAHTLACLSRLCMIIIWPLFIFPFYGSGH